MKVNRLSQVRSERFDSGKENCRQITLAQQLIRAWLLGRVRVPPFVRPCLVAAPAAMPIHELPIRNAVDPGIQRGASLKTRKRLPYAAEGPLGQVSRVRVPGAESAQKCKNSFIEFVHEFHRGGG